MSDDLQTRPDWVILGGQTTGGVTIIASKELNTAELTVELERDDPPWFGASRYRPPVRIIKLTTDLRTFVVIRAGTYEQALRRLFETWTPEPDERLPLPGAQPAIGGRR